MTDASSFNKPDVTGPAVHPSGRINPHPEPDLEPDSAQVAEIAANIDFADPSLTIAFGAKTMADIAKFADALLVQVRARDSGPVGQVLSALLARIKDMDIAETAGQEPGWAARLPVLGSLFDPMAKAQARFNTLADGVDNVVVNLQEAMTRLLRDIEVMEQLYELNRNFHRELTLDIAAGKKRLEQAYAEDLPRLQDAARKVKKDATGGLAAQAARDFADKLNRFERRLYDLQLARAVTLQTAPQIRLIQGNDQTLAEKIQASILTAIPTWKAQMVLALSIHGQKQAARLQQEVADTTNTLLRKNADMLHDAAISTAREAERGIVDIESLREVHHKLLSAVEETLRIAAEARDKRRDVEKELCRMEDNLRDRLADLSERGASSALADSSAAPAQDEPAPPAPDTPDTPDTPDAPDKANTPATLRLGSPEMSREHLGSPELAREHLAALRPATPRLETQKDHAPAPMLAPQGRKNNSPANPLPKGSGTDPHKPRE